MNEKGKFEVFLQSFSDEITDEFICEFSCTKCKQKVKSTPKVQTELACGGIGHKCLNCNTYLALFQCPNCMSNLTVDDEEWEKLADPKGVNCPSCNVILFRERENWRPQMGSSGILLPGLKAWSNTEIEKFYISKIRRNFSKNEQKTITILHHSVGVRMKSAKDSLDYLTDNDWYSPFILSNTSIPMKEDAEYKSPFDHDFHNNLFGFINNLRSSLDIFTQEVMSIINHGYPESKIEFNKIMEFVKSTTIEVKNITKKYSDSESYNYLNKLRNVLQHRRIPLMVTIGSYNTSKLDTIRPKNVRSIASVKLPRDPYSTDNSDNINSYNVMLFPKIKEIYNDTEKFMIDIYERIIP